VTYLTINLKYHNNASVFLEDFQEHFNYKLNRNLRVFDKHAHTSFRFEGSKQNDICLVTYYFNKNSYGKLLNDENKKTRGETQIQCPGVIGHFVLEYLLFTAPKNVLDDIKSLSRVDWRIHSAYLANSRNSDDLIRFCELQKKHNLEHQEEKKLKKEQTFQECSDYSDYKESFLNFNGLDNQDFEQLEDEEGFRHFGGGLSISTDRKFFKDPGTGKIEPYLGPSNTVFSYVNKYTRAQTVYIGNLGNKHTKEVVRCYDKNEVLDEKKNY
jgi:hypothetical protein